MKKRKLTKADIDKVRHIEGFPIARDEDIIALSDPPYYTACPNPFIEDFIRENGTPYDEATDEYKCEPFAADVSEGKNDPIYNAHSYHTKVPHKAIMRYILHYTKPGDIVYDGFCGTGMTGVAAQMCGSPDPAFKMDIEKDMPGVEWGVRKAVLSDLAPAASFIAYNYNSSADVDKFREESQRILEKVQRKYAWMYETQHIIDGQVQSDIDGNPIMGRINCTIWSDVLICATCSKEFVLWDVALDREKGKVRDLFHCPHCESELKKTDCEKAQELYFDKRTRENISMVKMIPVLINYTAIVPTSGKERRFEKTPDDFDLALIEKISTIDIPDWFPSDRMCEGGESRRNDRIGITHVHQFYTKRNLAVLAMLRDCLNEPRLSMEYTSLLERCSKQNRVKIVKYFHGGGGWVGGSLSGTLYIPSFSVEVSALKTFADKIKKAVHFGYAKDGNTIISVQSTTDLIYVPNNAIDYIFTDPPFGGNLNYSELSFLWEAWLKVFTSQKSEAIVNAVHGKGLPEYQALMTACFAEYYRILKPGRWITVEFHNSQNAVWNSIQEALQRVGFVIADVRTLDKKQASFKQVTTTSAVKQDLVISAYKPKESFKREFLANAGDEETAWAFVRQHLENLPSVVIKNGKIEIIVERQAFLLFDRMVAYHIMHGLPVPIDSGDFYTGLKERFLERDGMYFHNGQVNEYDTARIENDVEVIQFALGVTNEKTAIAWLYQQLGMKPQTYAELQPQFMQEVKTVDKFEQMPELAVLLEDNFLQDEKGKWYVPDVTKAADVTKLREKKLVKEFDSYLETKGKLKLFRAEAIRAGFAKLWAEKNYKLIVDTAARLPENVINEDEKLMMYVDLSSGRV